MTRRALRQRVGRRVADFYQGAYVRTGGTATTHVIAELTDASGDEAAYIGWWLRDANGISHRVTDYAPASGMLTTAPVTDAAGRAVEPGVNETVELWRPYGQAPTIRPTPERIDDVINRAREELYYRAEKYVVTEAQVGRYLLGIPEDSLAGVAVQRDAASPYRWGPPGYHSHRAGELTLLTRRHGGFPIRGGQPVRVDYWARPAPFEGEADWWWVNPVWAAAEAAWLLAEDMALTDLKFLGVNLASRAALVEERNRLRLEYLPALRVLGG